MSSRQLSQSLPSQSVFKYDLKARRVWLTDQQLLDELRAFAGTIGNRVFTKREFDDRPGASVGRSRRRRITATTIQKRFGSWREGLRRVGIEGGDVHTYPAGELMDRLDEAWRKLGYPPGIWTLKRLTGLSEGPFVSRWGSIRNACVRLAAFHRGEISREQLLEGARTKPARRALSGSLRYEIMERDHFRCTCCGASPATDPSVRLEVDHIVPVCRGGTDERGNLRTLCGECNRGKGAKGGTKRSGKRWGHKRRRNK